MSPLPQAVIANEMASAKRMWRNGCNLYDTFEGFDPGAGGESLSPQIRSDVFCLV